jgi:hypothetical protein
MARQLFDSPMDDAAHGSPSAEYREFHPDDTFLRRHGFSILERRGTRMAIWKRWDIDHGGLKRFTEREAFDVAYAEEEEMRKAKGG